MKLFSYFYDKALRWAAHRHASWYLGGLSFAESSFFPVPPDVMLAPMCLARRERAWRYATITTLASTIGGLFGYAIGVWGLQLVEPLLQQAGYWDRYMQAREWFTQWGIWVVFIAGFSPIPYKLFTIAAGAAAMPIFPFVIASVVGRGLRFYAVAGIVRLGGEAMERMLREYIEYLGWLLVIALVIVIAAT